MTLFAPLRPAEQKHIPGEPGKGRPTALAACPALGVVAFSQAGLPARIAVFSYPSLELELELRDRGQAIEYAALSFSRDGALLAALSGIPDFRVTLWDWQRKRVVAEAAVEDDSPLELSFFPGNNQTVACVGQTQVNLFVLDETFGAKKLLKVPFPVALADDEVVTAHCWTVNGALVVGTSAGRLLLYRDATSAKSKTDVFPGLVLPYAFDGEVAGFSLTRRHLVVATTAGEVAWYSIEDGTVAHVQELEGSTPTGIDLNTKFDAFAVTTDENNLVLVTLEDAEPMEIETRATAFPSFHSEDVAGVAGVGSSSKFFTCGADGRLKLWDASESVVGLVMDLDFGAAVTAVQYCPDSRLLVAGLGTGEVHAYYCVDLDTAAAKFDEGVVGFDAGNHGDPGPNSRGRLAWLYADRHHAGGVASLAVSSSERFCASLDAAGEVSCFSLALLNGAWQAHGTKYAGGLPAGRAQERLKGMGGGGVPEKLRAEAAGAAICWVTKGVADMLAVAFEDASVLFYTVVANRKGEHILDLQRTTSVALPEAVDAMLGSAKAFYALSRDRAFCLYDIANMRTGSEQLYPAALSEVLLMTGTSVHANRGHRHVAVGSRDGYVRVFDGQLNVQREFSLFGADKGGCLSVSFVSDTQVLATGADGMVFLLNLACERSPAGSALAATEYSAGAREEDARPEGDKPISRRSSFKNLETAEDGSTGVDTQFLQKLGQIGEDLKALKARNAGATDLERLDKMELVIDQDLVAQGTEVADRAVGTLQTQTKFEIDFRNLLTHLIKGFTWDTCGEPDKMITVFDINSAIPPKAFSVHNYCIRKPTEAEAKKLRQVVYLRTLEKRTAWELLQREREDPDEGPAQPGQEEEPDGAEGGLDDSLIIQEKQDSSEQVGASGAGAAADDVNDTSIRGLLYPPFDVTSQSRQMIQRVLLDEQANELKRAFNAKFEELFQSKLAALDRMAEKCSRVNELYREIRSAFTMEVPVLRRDEEVGDVLKVNDDEVEAERVLTAEEKAALEAKEREEERLRLEALKDNMKERALKDMMGGTLVRKEKSVMDLPEKEPWMEQPEGELSPEQVQELRDFEKLYKQKVDEQTKFIKHVESEIRQLKHEVDEIQKAFDVELNHVFYERLEVEYELHVLELQAILLGNSVEGAINMKTKIGGITAELEGMQLHKSMNQSDLLEAKKYAERREKEHNHLVHEDRALERQFRKQFGENEFFDVMLRAFKNKPRRAPAQPGELPAFPEKGARRGSVDKGKMQRLKARRNSGGFALPPSPAGRNTPMMGKAPLSSQGARNQLYTPPTPTGLPGVGALEATPDPFAVAEAVVSPGPALHYSLTDCPEGLDPADWEQVLDLRDAKLHKAAEVAASQEEVATMMRRLQETVFQDEQEAQSIQSLFVEANNLTKDSAELAYDLSIYLSLKQAQVEVPQEAVVTDYSESVFLDREVIEELNGVIQDKGDMKLEIMHNVHADHKDMYMTEWKNELYNLKIDDLSARIQELQLLRSTKALQKAFKDGINEKKTEDEEHEWNAKIVDSQKVHREKVILKVRQLGNTEIAVEKKEEDNVSLQAKVESAQEVLRGQENMERSIMSEDSTMERKFRRLMNHRKLKYIIEQQKQDLILLRNQLDNLTNRAYPHFEAEPFGAGAPPVHPDLKDGYAEGRAA